MKRETDDIEARRKAYAAARAELMHLIDNPDKTVSVNAYKEQIRVAQSAVAAAYRELPTIGTW